MMFILMAFIFSTGTQISSLVVDIERSVVSSGDSDFVRGTIFYQPPDGPLLHITHPVNQWIKYGEKSLVIYYPEEKTAFRIQADLPFVLPFFQTFLGVTQSGLGLPEMGFSIGKTETRAETLITRWDSPKNLKKRVGPIIIGIVNDRIGFMEMLSSKGKTIGRVTYANYKKFDGVWLPLKVSAVRFPGKDTTYETVVYTNPRVNTGLPEAVTGFAIPEGVRVKEVHW